MILSRILLVLSVLAIAGCWQSEDNIYNADDYFLPVQGDLVTISDEFGPLGVYSINSENQYVPVFKEAEKNSFEQKFRMFDIGFIPVDRMAAYKKPREDWRANHTFSRSIFQDEETLLFISTLQQAEQPGQLLLTSFVSNDVIGICSTLLQEGKGLHEEFSEFASIHAPEQAFTRKAGIAMLVLNEVTEAKRRGELECDEYKIETHSHGDQDELFEAVTRGDAQRKAQAKQQMTKMKASAVELAEARASRQIAKNAGVSEKTELTPKEQLATLNQKLSSLHREAYDINNELESERWGTLDGVGGKYFGVERNFRNRGLLFKSKMLCHNLSGYQAIYVTVTHASSSATNAAWAVRRGDTIPVRIETERGTIIHNAALKQVNKTLYTNTLSLTFADLIPSRLDNKYVQDPAALERMRRQAKLFGTSVEGLMKMAGGFLSLEEAMKSKTLKIYADIRQNGTVRTVMLGDFGSESDEKGLKGFHAACLFNE